MNSVREGAAILYKYMRKACCCCKDVQYQVVTPEAEVVMPVDELKEIPSDLPIIELLRFVKPTITQDDVTYKIVDPKTHYKFILTSKRGDKAYDRQHIRAEIIAKAFFAHMGFDTVPCRAYINHANRIFSITQDLPGSDNTLQENFFMQQKNIWQLQDCIFINMLLGMPGQNLANWRFRIQKDQQICMQIAHLPYALGTTPQQKQNPFLPELDLTEICKTLLNAEKTAAANPGNDLLFDCAYLAQAHVDNLNPFTDLEVMLNSIRSTADLTKLLEDFSKKISNEVIYNIVTAAFAQVPENQRAHALEEVIAKHQQDLAVDLIDGPPDQNLHHQLDVNATLHNMSGFESEQDFMIATLKARRNFIIHYFELLLQFKTEQQPAKKPSFTIDS